MPELLLDIQDDGAGADFVLEAGDFKLDYGLRTNVFVSLYSDARAPDADEQPYSEHENPRGWWGDRADMRLGSKLWLLERGKLIEGLLADVEAWAKESLAWLVDDGIARSVTVTATRGGDERLDLVIVLERGRAARWQALWTGEEAAAVGETRVHLLTR